MVNEDPLNERINELEQWVNLINDRARRAAETAAAAAAAAAEAAEAAVAADIPQNDMINALPAEDAARAAADAARAAATTQTAIEAEHPTLRDAIANLRSRYQTIMRMDPTNDGTNQIGTERSSLDGEISAFNSANVERIEALLPPDRGARGGRRLRKRGQESRRRSSSARKSSSRRGRRSAKKRGTQRKQKRRQRRGSRRAY
jgi:hypothetical protein